MDKLLPCPFCGNDAPGFYQDENVAVIVVCSACNAEGPWELRASEALAAMDWNRRASATPDPALLALAKFAARIVNDYHRGKWGFISADGDWLDMDAADAGVKEYQGAVNLAPGIAAAIAALLAPDAPGVAGEEATDA